MHGPSQRPECHRGDCGRDRRGYSDEISCSLLREFRAPGAVLTSSATSAGASTRKGRCDAGRRLRSSPDRSGCDYQAARAGWPDKRIVVFRTATPHRDLCDDFANTLDQVDILLMLDVYAAGEPVIPGRTAVRCAVQSASAVSWIRFWSPNGKNCSGWHRFLKIMI